MRLFSEIAMQVNCGPHIILKKDIRTLMGGRGTQIALTNQCCIFSCQVGLEVEHEGWGKSGMHTRECVHLVELCMRVSPFGDIGMEILSGCFITTEIMLGSNPIGIWDVPLWWQNAP